MTEKEIKERFTQIDKKITKALDLGNEALKSIDSLDEKIESFKKSLINADEKDIKEAVSLLRNMRQKNKQIDE